MAFPEYTQYDALGLAELVRKKALHPRELVETAIARIERDNPKLNAVITRMFDAARALADTPSDGVFGGVPFLAKDLISTWDGVRQASGTRFMKEWVAPHDSELVRRYRKSGIICLGKTNTPELGLLPVTEPVAFGPTRNPWDVSRTPGGSSGGAAAAVSSGMVPMAGGGDGGGSIRIPASCCGLFGLKPTRARTPLGPDYGELWQGCAIEHVVTRSVRDSAAMLDAISGIDDGAPYAAPEPARPFLEEVGAAPGKLRIAFTPRALLPAVVHPDCVGAVEDAAALLRSLGHEVTEEHPAFDAEQFSLDFLTMLVGETAADLRQAEQLLMGRRARSGEIEPATRMLTLLGDAVSAVDYALAARRIKASGRAFAPFFRRYDLLLTPTLAQPPIAIGAMAPKGAEKVLVDVVNLLNAGELARRIGALPRIAAQAWDFTPFTAPFNATGQPACSVPLHWNGDGLPIGVQLVGRFGDEATLLRVSSQLETARPWAQRRPAGFAD